MKNRRIKPEIMKTKFLFAILTLFFFSGCQFFDKNKSTEIESKPSSHEKWSYTGESGPEHWAELEDQAVCDGQHQSPVNISDIDIKPGKLIQESLDLSYQEVTTIKSITNNGHTIQYNFDANSNLVSSSINAGLSGISSSKNCLVKVSGAMAGTENPAPINHSRSFG